MNSLINKLWLYIKYPITLNIDLHKLKNYRKYKKLGLEGFPPNYIFFNRFNEKSTALDVGCGFAAEFSVTLINRYKVKAYGVDPTQKHQPFLKEIEKKMDAKFCHLNYALSATNGESIFYESLENESGSLLKTHKNILADTVKGYKVQLIDLHNLIAKTGKTKIDILKIDIEGAEYKLFNPSNLEALKMVEQLFLEFHHLSVKDYTRKDTLRLVEVIKNEGFNYFSYDGINYLFYRDKL